MTDTTVVLVHGAFAESSSWSGVIALLQQRDVSAIATPNQLRGLTSDADNVRRAVGAIGGPVLLVGHSYGGAVITQAAADTGQTVRPYPLGDGTNDLIVDRDLFPDQFAGDLPRAEARIAAATQRPIRDYALGEPLGAEKPAWKTLPSWFVFGSGDKNIPVEGLRFMAERAGSLKTREIDGASHSVMVSDPEAVADLIGEALAHLA